MTSIARFLSLSTVTNRLSTRKLDEPSNVKKLLRAHLHDTVLAYDCSFWCIRLTHQSSSGSAATLVSKPNTWNVPMRQHYIPQDEQLHTTIISCKWVLCVTIKVCSLLNLVYLVKLDWLVSHKASQISFLAKSSSREYHWGLQTLRTCQAWPIKEEEICELVEDKRSFFRAYSLACRR